MKVAVPAGYSRIDDAQTTIVARTDEVDAVMAAYRAAPRCRPTLHGYAAAARDARPLQGRETAYALSLPMTGTAVVIRHNRHGGALRALTGDLFLGQTRAPRELELSLRLADLGIPSPAILAYAVYRAGIIARSDVVSQEIAGSADFGSLLLTTAPDDPNRREAWDAVIALVDQLSDAGARHHDLNVKNVLVRPTPAGAAAYLIDVDRVELDLAPAAARAGNYTRLGRSLDKWRRLKGARITGAELETLRRKAPSSP